MQLFDFTGYREFIKDWIKNRPKKGRGELMKIALHTHLHTSTLSQILRGDRSLTLEQAALLSEYMGLDENESRYFLLLVQLDKAGNRALKTILLKQIKEAKENRVQLSHRIPSDKLLSEEDKSTFYSGWFYSAVRILSSIEEFKTIEALETRLSLPRPLLNQVIHFLVNKGLCVQTKGVLSPGPAYTHLESTSPLTSRHHANWRVKAMERHPILSKEELCYTSPVSISVKDADKVQKLLADLIQEIQKLRAQSDSEVAYCLNMDWFKF